MARRVHLVPKVRQGPRVQMARTVLMARQVLPDHRGPRAMQARLDRRDQKGRLDLRVHKVRLAPRVLMVLQVSAGPPGPTVPPDQQEVMVHLDLQGQQGMVLLVLLDLPGHRELTVHLDLTGAHWASRSHRTGRSDWTRRTSRRRWCSGCRRTTGSIGADGASGC